MAVAAGALLPSVERAHGMDLLAVGNRNLPLLPAIVFGAMVFAVPYRLSANERTGRDLGGWECEGTSLFLNDQF